MFGVVFLFDIVFLFKLVFNFGMIGKGRLQKKKVKLGLLAEVRAG